MSQKSSVPQAVSFVSQVLKRDREVSNKGKTSAENLKVQR